jgi:hypothetical protein
MLVRSHLCSARGGVRDAMGAEDDDDASGVLQSTRRFLLGTGLNGGKILPLSELLKGMGGDVSGERELKALFDGRAA